MPDQIYIGNFAKGLKTNPLPFNVDNDAFPTLYNAYSWRGRVKRKRGTQFLARLRRQISEGSGNYSTVLGTNTFSIFNRIGINVTQPNATLVPGNIAPITIIIDGGIAQVLTDILGNGTMTVSGAGPITSATINYATGIVTITSSSAAGPVGTSVTLSYYPNLPVLGLEDVVRNIVNEEFPVLQAFDTTYSYQINQNAVPFFYSTSFYKITNNPVVWSNTNDKQFWSTNYQSAFWVTNDKSGLHLVNGTYISGSGTTDITFNFVYPSYSSTPSVPYLNLVVGDILWFNEWPLSSTINGNINVNTNGTVLTIVGGGTYIVRFPMIETVSGTGIAQLLTNSIPGQDGIRWYDGDPTSGTGLPTGTGLGWVNFAPPITASTTTYDDQISGQYYLVGALAILPFKDRLLVFGPQIQTSGNAAIQQPIEDVVQWSWNGTPYYNALVPTNLNNTETFDVRSWYVDQTGFGGYLPAGISQPIVTVLNNEDVLHIGFGGTGKKTRFIYTGNDLQPFLFYLINSELPSSSTFSGVVLDRGGLEIGSYGITLTTQQSSQRIDLDIPDEVFEIQALNNGQNRVNAIRDFYREWVYFAYPTGDGAETNGSWVFPSQTFLFNYRDNTWAILRENFTRHGIFRKSTGYTWANPPFPTWAQWLEPWSGGSSQALFPSIIAGNPQGYVLIKGEGTGEGISGDIQAIANDGFGFTQITSANHCVNSGAQLDVPSGDYLYFQNALGSTFINLKIGLVTRTIDANNFVVDIPYVTSVYLGLGNYSRLSQPLIQTKQFPFYWEQGRQLRLGVQRYLMDRTATGQVTININLSQDPETAWNFGPIVPSQNVLNSSLEYSQILFTCPESTNLGLTPANVNLQMPTAAGQFQIWHRLNTSLQGDSVQIGITLSDLQMRDLTLATSEIALHGIQLTIYPGPLTS